MNANDVVESYVTDVARQLPRRQRNDVAFELRALLNEGLQDKADAAGRGADAAMAIEFVRAFGSPEDVAARYRPALTIIDSQDGHKFLRAAAIGLALIWGLGLLALLKQPGDSPSGFLGVLGQWWGHVLASSMWWLGLLAAYYGLGSWARRRWPRTSAWRPRAADRIVGSRATLVMGLIGIVCGLLVLVEPTWLLDFFWNGRAAPAAYEALTYTDTFRRRQGPWLLALLVLNIPVFVAVIVSGRWLPTVRRIHDALGLVTCAAIVWAVLGGPMLMTPASDRTARFLMLLVVVTWLVALAIKSRGGVRPAPDAPFQS